MEIHLKQMLNLHEEGIPFVSATLVDSKGSTPRTQGGKIIVTTSGLFSGTVGGGLVEAKAVQFAKTLLKINAPTEKTKFVEWNLNKDIGMSCGGSVKIFFEIYNLNSWEIIIFGAGHVSQALIPVLLKLETKLTCLDTRKEWLGKLPESPKLTKVLKKSLLTTIEKIPETAFVLVMTKGHRSDFYIVKQFLEIKKQAFLGVIGSRSKASTLKKELLKEGFNEEKINQIVCPIGFSLGGNHPQEIAISITSQLLFERDRLYGRIHSRNPLPGPLCIK